MIKQSNFRIWQVKRDQFGKPILGQLELLKEITGEPANQNYRDILVKDQEYSLLTTTPGFFSSKEVNSKVVTETEVTRNKGASVSGIPLGGGNNKSEDSNSKKFDIGPIATAKNLKSTAKQDNNPSILGSWTKNSASDLSGINQDPNNTKGPLEESHTGIYFAYAPRVFSELAKNSSATIKSATKELNEQQKEDQAKKIAVKQRKKKSSTSKAKKKTIDFKYQGINVEDFMKELLRHAGIPLKSEQNLVEEKAQGQPNFLTKLLDFVIPTASADELPYEIPENILPSQPTKSCWQKIAEHEAKKREIEVEQSKFLANKFKSWLEERGANPKVTYDLYGIYYDTSLDESKRQVEWLKSNVTSMLDKYRTLTDKFTVTSWRPLQYSGRVKTHTVGTKTDKNGRRYYKDLNTGKFSESAWKKAKNSARKGEMNSSAIDASFTEKFTDKSTCWKFDFLRTTKTDNPDIEVGGRVYICDNTSAGYSIDANGVDIEVSIDNSVGINLATGEKKSSLGTTRMDLDALTGSLKAEGHINTNEEQTSVGAEAVALFKGFALTGEFKSEAVCTENICLQATVTAFAGIGIGIQGGAGYNSTIEKKDTFTVSAGLGLIPMLGAKITVEKEPKQKNIENTSPPNPRPPL
jgi:hypothetical protein